MIRYICARPAQRPRIRQWARIALLRYRCDIEKGAGGVSTIPLTAGEKGLTPALEQPAFGQLRGANELRKRGLVVPSAGVRLRVAGLGADRGPVGPIDVG